MGMQSYAGGGYVLEITPKVLENLNLPSDLDLDDYEQDENCIFEQNSDIVANQFVLHVGCEPTMVFIGDDFEGLDNVETGKWYAVFYDNQLFNMVPNKQYKRLTELEMEPDNGSWTVYS